MGNLGFLSSCDGDLSEPNVLPDGSQVSFQVGKGSAGLLSSHYRRIDLHLALRGESRVVSQAAVVSFEFFSSCDRDLSESIMLPPGFLASF